MDIKVASGDIIQQKVGAIVVNLFEGVNKPQGATEAVDHSLDGAISALINDGEIRGKRGELTLIHTLGKIAPSRVLVVGLGKAASFTVDTVRSVTAESSRYLRNKGIETIATIPHGAGVAGLESRESGKAIAEGTILGLYRFDKYKNNEKDTKREVHQLTLIESDKSKISALEEGVSEGLVVADATNICRDMVNEPPNIMTPTQMAEVALEVAKESGLQITILERSQMLELGMGALLGVAQGSEEPPKFIILQYQGDPNDESNSLALLGKGITFDSGGLDLKSAASMTGMKADMAGGAAVIASMKAIGQLKPKINVTAIVPATENMVGGAAQRPGDIVRAMNGKTIEIDNTDAEGRLVLADAAAYACSIGLKRLIDVATLTGAVNIALGDLCVGACGNDQSLVDSVITAGAQTGERIWQLPTYDEYKDQYKSSVADIKNTGGRGAGAIIGAMIIGEFYSDASWVHLDIASTDTIDREMGYYLKGPTGVPVRTLVAVTQNLAKA